MKKIIAILIGFICSSTIVFAGVTQCRVYNSNSNVKLVQKIVEADDFGQITISLQLDEKNPQQTRVRVCIWDLDDNTSAGCKTCYILKGETYESTTVGGLEKGHTYELSIDIASCD